MNKQEPPFKLKLLATAVIGLWAVFGIGTYLTHSQWQERGQFGDMFGAVNALFSALAFAVLIYTMWLQRIELELQREELRETKQAIQQSTDAQLRQVQIAALSAQLATLNQILVLPEQQRTRLWREVANAPGGPGEEFGIEAAIAEQIRLLEKLATEPKAFVLPTYQKQSTPGDGFR